MWSLLCVVGDVGLEYSLEVSRVVDQDVVETLLAHGPHEPLRERVRPRCADRCSDDADALGAEHLVERARELRVSVADEEPGVPEPFVDREVPRLLRDPRRVGVRRDAHHMHSPGRKLDSSSPNSHVSGCARTRRSDRRARSREAEDVEEFGASRRREARDSPSTGERGRPSQLCAALRSRFDIARGEQPLLVRRGDGRSTVVDAELGEQVE
jgi:hypothetical protein